MKNIYTAALLFVLYSSALGNTISDAIIINNYHQVFFHFVKSDPCVNTYSFDFEGTVDAEVIKVIREYILNKVGICSVDFNLETQKITVNVTDKIDFDSVKWLVRKAFHDYAIHEDNH